MRKRKSPGAFGITVTFRWHKGYQDSEIPLMKSKNLEPAQSMEHIHLDLGILMVAYFYRRGCFGSRTLEDIIDGDDLVIQPEPEFVDQPLFLNLSEKGLRLTDERFKCNNAIVWFASVLARAGLDRKCLALFLSRYYSFNGHGSNGHVFLFISARFCTKAS